MLFWLVGVLDERIFLVLGCAVHSLGCICESRRLGGVVFFVRLGPRPARRKSLCGKGLRRRQKTLIILGFLLD